MSTSKPVYIIQPLEHGGGGCYGQKILDTLSLEEALKISNPYIKYNRELPQFEHYYIRICYTQNMNDWIYMWNEDEGVWDGT